MRMNPFSGIALTVAGLVILSTSCTKETSSDSIADNTTLQSAKKSAVSLIEQSADGQLLKDVKKATTRFHSTTHAIRAGYVPSSHCVSVPGLGGMGFHWANPGLIDNVYDPLKPEVVLYATGPDGALKLVAVEYIVLNTGQAAPTFGSQAFDLGGTPVSAPHWSLHVWLYQENPLGMFRQFNPTITCN